MLKQHTQWYHKHWFMRFNAYASMFKDYWDSFTCRLGVDFLGNWGRPEPKWCCNFMAVDEIGFRQHPTFILDVFKVFYHLDMMWMGIWVHPHTVTPVQSGVGFSDLSLSHVVMSWLRLKPSMECIPHPFELKQSVFVPWYAMNGHMGPPLHCYIWAGLGWIFGDIWIDLSLSNDVMSWLNLKPPVECIPHPYDM